MKIAFVASEVFPYAKTGGLADVAGSLPIELSNLGSEVKIFMPKYNMFGEVEHGLHYQWNIGEIPLRVNGQVHSVHVHTAKLPRSNVEVYFVDCPYFFHRFRVYTNDHDEDERFILFMKGVIEILQRIGWAPDVIHCNDWQTGLLPLLLRENYGWDKMFHRTATVFSIHNIAYQGKFSKETFSKAEIRPEHYVYGGLGEHEGGVNFMKTAILTSDVINTVSQTYAHELLTPEYGEGMQSFLHSRAQDFYGIINGIDYHVWNPEKDVLLPYQFSSDDLSGKLQNKKFLVEQLGFHYDENIPLIGIISRMVSQKGFDIIGYALNELMQLNAQWVILGSGEHRYEEMFMKIKEKYPHKVYFYRGFNNELSHFIEAASDIFLMPSRFEPCGLNQIYSLKYGTVPVVRKTGGLADTVLDWNEHLAQGQEIGTGYSFHDYTAHALILSVQRALHDFNLKNVWYKIQQNGMNKDYSWRKSAEKYIELYKQAVIKRLG
ncbi:MAG: glycogen synthase [Ignavibacteriales bacterium]|nr:glycogen synthase [Ignavibacteriales bacterium]